MATIPGWLIASDADPSKFSVTVQALTRAAGGAVSSAGGAVTVTALVDAVDQEFTEELVDISPMSVRGENMVGVKEGFQLGITEIWQSDVGLALAPIFFSYTYFLVTIIGGLDHFTYYARRAGATPAIVNGKSTFKMNFRRTEAGVTNPAHSP